jgi:hypothetical protein
MFAKHAVSFLAAILGTANLSEAAVDVGSRAQVFIDKVLVGSAESVTFTLQPAKTRDNPAGPWLYYQNQRGGPAGPMVLYDQEEKLFKSWSPGDANYNTSPNGITWSTPEKSNDTWRYIVRVSVIKDLNDPDPARRYKLLTFGPSRPFPPGMKDADPVTNPDGAKTLFWHLLGYNWVGNAYSRKPLPAWFGEHNVQAAKPYFWDSEQKTDFTVPEKSEAREAGLDLSRPIGLNGRTFEPLPGMKPGYFPGTAPDLGVCSGSPRE